ncbi:phospholipase A-2-activating protein [Sistotremastrum niveocremeum HHB9708]|uniref:Phospholipase A-2-activating protein n=1 Tax=Sistotremastrum niveocremeum HHB9708 TaxID=1314777 RepID=A0A164QWN4_9AGAM|nr:phospholipase A-2-activating protein [Sistotremastrum niveocremeum HHB9708]
MPYKLSSSLVGHASDVRAVVSPTDSLILSASRDTTAIAWSKDSATNAFTRSDAYNAGSRYINAITYIPPGSGRPTGYVVTGGQDTVVNVFALGSPSEPEYSLLGHRDNVCALDATEDGTIVSGSWDRSARVWRNFTFDYELLGHDQAVWAVLAVGKDSFLTGSADKTIKLWESRKEVKTYRGHTDAVRGLALVPNIGFASCSNDSEIHVWTTGGDIVYTLSGHTSFVYSISVLPSGDIISGGEDRSLRVWQDGSCTQTIVHPAISVWSVSSTPNGDLVTGCSDGIVRVFSNNEQRWAPAEEIQEYEQQVAKQALPSHQVGDLKKSDLPGPEALAKPGKKSGQVITIRNGSTVEAHQWDSTENQWQKIGDVVDAIGSSRKQLHEGKEYDYVFDVDIQEGVPPLKLPYNATENPYEAAQRFLQSNDLPLSYIDQVVQFIETNTSGVTLGDSSSQYVDPYTGASRYVSSGSSTNTGSQGAVDPYTGASRYQAPAPSASVRASPAAPLSTSAAPATKIIPVTQRLTFRQANITALRGKLLQFNNDAALETSELESLETCLSSLNTAIGDSRLPPAAITPALAQTIVGILGRWPAPQRFPLLDLSRLIILFAPKSFRAPGSSTIDALLRASEWDQPWELPLAKYRETNLLLTLRSLVNSIHGASSLDDLPWAPKILQDLRARPYDSIPKALRTPIATLLLNLSCVMIERLSEEGLREDILAILSTIISNEAVDAEAGYRAAAAFGNIIYLLNLLQRSLNAAERRSAESDISKLIKRFSEERIRKLGDEILGLLRS